MIKNLDEAEPIEPTPKAKRASPIAQTVPENTAIMYDPDEDEYFFIPKTATKTKVNTKDFIKPKPEPKSKTKDNIYSGNKYEGKHCQSEFRNKIALTSHSNSHNRKYLENTEYFDVNSSQNMKEIYNTDKTGNYIEDIDEAIKLFRRN